MVTATCWHPYPQQRRAPAHQLVYKSPRMRLYYAGHGPPLSRLCATSRSITYMPPPTHTPARPWGCPASALPSPLAGQPCSCPPLHTNTHMHQRASGDAQLLLCHHMQPPYPTKHTHAHAPARPWGCPASRAPLPCRPRTSQTGSPPQGCHRP